MKQKIIGMLIKYETATPKLEDVARDLYGDDHATMLRKARNTKLRTGGPCYPFPIFRMGGQKSPWLCDIADVVKHVEQETKDARSNFETQKAS